MARRRGAKATMAWLGAARQDAPRALGRAPWTYGVKANRTELATLLRYSFEDGLSDRLLEPNDIFEPVS